MRKNWQTVKSTLQWIAALGIWSFIIYWAITFALIYHQFGQAISDSQSMYRIKDAVFDFHAKYGFLPGDFPDAENRLPNCKNCNPSSETAGDGIIGEADFARTLTHPHPTNPASESELFWRHLEAAAYNVQRRSATGDFFVVGYADGKPVTDGIGNKIKGNILVITSPTVLRGEATINTKNAQPFTASYLVGRDNGKIDDSQANNGRVQAYGAKECVKKCEHVDRLCYNMPKKRKEFYEFESRDCGLIFILDHPFRAKSEKTKSTPNTKKKKP